MNEKEYMNAIAELNCIICNRPAQLHHPRFAAGMGQRAANFLVIPLCPDHHTDGGPGVALHAGQTTFERMYGTEEQLLSDTIKKFVSRLK